MNSSITGQLAIATFVVIFLWAAYGIWRVFREGNSNAKSLSPSASVAVLIRNRRRHAVISWPLIFVSFGVGVFGVLYSVFLDPDPWACCQVKNVGNRLAVYGFMFLILQLLLRRVK